MGLTCIRFLSLPSKLPQFSGLKQHHVSTHGRVGQKSSTGWLGPLPRVGMQVPRYRKGKCSSEIFRKQLPSMSNRNAYLHPVLC